VACLWPSDHLTSDPTDPDHLTLDPMTTDQVANPHRCIQHCTSVLWTHKSHTRWGKRHRCAMYLSKELFKECWSPSMMKFEVLGRVTDVRAVNNQRQHRRLVNTTLQHSLHQSALNTQLDTVPTDLCWLSYYNRLCVSLTDHAHLAMEELQRRQVLMYSNVVKTRLDVKGFFLLTARCDVFNLKTTTVFQIY